VTVEWTVNPVLPMLVELADCVCEHLEVAGSGPTCWCGIYPGASVSWDYCGECDSGKCGMGYIRPDIAFPYETFPTPTLDESCERTIAWRFEVGVVRCIPTMEEDGSLPSPADVSEAAVNLLQDQWALHKAIRCCEFTRGSIVLESWTPTGPQGGCVGGFWSCYVDPYH